MSGLVRGRSVRFNIAAPLFNVNHQKSHPQSVLLGPSKLPRTPTRLSSHLMSCGSCDCSKPYWTTASLHKVFSVGLKSKTYRSVDVDGDKSPLGMYPPKRIIQSPTMQQYIWFLLRGPSPLVSIFFQDDVSGLNFHRSFRSSKKFLPPNMNSSPL